MPLAEEGVGALAESARVGALGPPVIAVAFLARILIVVAQTDGCTSRGSRHLLPTANGMTPTNVRRGTVTGVDPVDREDGETLVRRRG